MRYSLLAVLAVSGLFLLTACAEQEMDAAETGNAEHAPAVAPTVTPGHAPDSAGGHDAHGTNPVPTTTSH